MKARMVDDLEQRMVEFFESPLDADEEARAFWQSISGKEVELVFTHGDAFEKVDNNHWLPNEMWTECRED